MKIRRESMNNRRQTVFDGVFADNTVLSAFMIVSPVIICGDTMSNAIALICAFSVITFASVILASFVPKKLPYALRIISYAVISSVIYIPVRYAANDISPEAVGRIGIYFPLLAVNSLIVLQTEARFFRMKRIKMIFSLLFYIIRFDAVMVLTAFIRELLAYGTINSRIVDAKIIISGVGQPFGGFIFLGLLCGIYRMIRSSLKRNPGTVRGDEDVSGI